MCIYIYTVLSITFVGHVTSPRSIEKCTKYQVAIMLLQSRSVLKFFHFYSVQLDSASVG